MQKGLAALSVLNGLPFSSFVRLMSFCLPLTQKAYLKPHMPFESWNTPDDVVFVIMISFVDFLLEVYILSFILMENKKYFKALFYKTFFRCEAIVKHRDEARHGKAFEGLLKRYFNK